MLMNETELYGEIKKALQRSLVRRGMQFHHLHYTRVESPITQGVPDINVKIKGYSEFWIEGKIYPYPLSPFQKGWLKQRAECGGKAYVLAYSNEDRAFMMLYPVSGIFHYLDEAVELIMLDLLIEEGEKKDESE